MSKGKLSKRKTSKEEKENFHIVIIHRFFSLRLDVFSPVLAHTHSYIYTLPLFTPAITR